MVETALTTMVDGFGLAGVVLAAQGPPPERPVGAGASPAGAGEGPPTFLAARLPPSWAAESQILFEVYGNLWNSLQRPGPAAGAGRGSDDQRPVEPTPIEHGLFRQAGGGREQWQVPIGRHWVLLSRMDDDGLPVAAAAIRKAPFTPDEAEALGTVIGSVVAACSDSGDKAAIRQEIRSGTTATLKSVATTAGAAPATTAAASNAVSTAASATASSSGSPSAPVELQAEVDADWELRSGGGDGVVAIGGRRRGVGRGPDPVVAVARAAAKACRPRCEIAFAGASELEDVVVSIVMIRHVRHGLRLGYAVRQKGDHTGAAEAVFTAAG